MKSPNTWLTWLKVCSIIIGSYGAFMHHFFLLVIGFVGLILAFCLDSLVYQWRGIPKIYPARMLPALCKKREKHLLRKYGKPKTRELESLRWILRGFGSTRLVTITQTTIKLGDPPHPNLVLKGWDLESGDKAYEIIQLYIDQYLGNYAKEGQSSCDLKVH